MDHPMSTSGNILKKLRLFQGSIYYLDVTRLNHNYKSSSKVPTQIYCIFKFPVFSLSDGKISLCQFTDLADIPSFKFFWRISWQISKYLSSLESGNLQLGQTKFPVFSLKGIFFPIFPVSPVQWVPYTL